LQAHRLLGLEGHEAALQAVAIRLYVLDEALEIKQLFLVL
jgi:hypothetical protein